MHRSMKVPGPLDWSFAGRHREHWAAGCQGVRLLERMYAVRRRWVSSTLASQPLEFGISRTCAYVLVTADHEQTGPWNGGAAYQTSIKPQYYSRHRTSPEQPAPRLTTCTTVFLGLGHLAWPRYMRNQEGAALNS